MNSAIERVVVVEKITLEIMPNEFTDQLLIQLRTSLQDSASDPFKLASSINPTKFTLDLVKLSKVIPAILFPVPVSNFAVCRVQSYTDADTFQAYGRVTTRVRVLPQRSLLSTIPAFIAEVDTSAGDTKPVNEEVTPLDSRHRTLLDTVAESRSRLDGYIQA